MSGIPPPPPPPPGTAPATVPRTPRPTYTGKSDDPTDHYWCGVGLDDARNKCIQHCPGGTSGESRYATYHQLRISCLRISNGRV